MISLLKKGMRPDQLLELLDINVGQYHLWKAKDVPSNKIQDPAALESVLAPPPEDKPKYAFDRWEKKETVLYYNIIWDSLDYSLVSAWGSGCPRSG